MSDQVKLLKQARTMRNVARQSRSVAQQLSKASYRQFVLSYADVVELQADGLERLALENTKTASLQESDRRRDAVLDGEVASGAAQPTGSLGFGISIDWLDHSMLRLRDETSPDSGP